MAFTKIFNAFGKRWACEKKRSEQCVPEHDIMPLSVAISRTAGQLERDRQRRIAIIREDSGDGIGLAPCAAQETLQGVRFLQSP
jgi:hypothetical protein